MEISTTRSKLLKKYNVTNEEYRKLVKERKSKAKKQKQEKHKKALLGRKGAGSTNTSKKK